MTTYRLRVVQTVHVDAWVDADDPLEARRLYLAAARGDVVAVDDYADEFVEIVRVEVDSITPEP